MLVITVELKELSIVGRGTLSKSLEIQTPVRLKRIIQLSKIATLLSVTQMTPTHFG